VGPEQASTTCATSKVKRDSGHCDNSAIRLRARAGDRRCTNGNGARDRPPPEPAPLQLFQSLPPTSTGGWISLKAVDFWKSPMSGSEPPRWTVGRTATLIGPRGIAFSAGVSGRRGDPMPLYLSQPALTQSLPAGLITGPWTYRTQWDISLGVAVPMTTIHGVNLRAFGDLIVPVRLVDSANPAAPLLNSRAIRFGMVALF